MTIRELRRQLIAADTAGDVKEAAKLADELMKRDKAVGIAVCSILELSIYVVKRNQERTAVMEELRYEAIAA